MADQEDVAFDKVLEVVGNDGKFQKVFNHFYNVGLVCFASMAYMNIVMTLNEPNHSCYVPGKENFSLSDETWKNLTLPTEKDNRGVESISSCKMYNISNFIDKPVENWNFTEADKIECAYGYDYDKTWYKRTVVSDEDWVCNKTLYQTNTFVFHRIGEIVGTFVFGQLGDTIGRKPVFYVSSVIIIVGRIMTTLTPSIYFLFAIASACSMLTSMSIFLSPLIIAMETSKEEDRAHIAMMQCIGWTLGMCIMPLTFWAVGDWVWFLMITTLPIGLFALYPKYMIESPRWLATKRHLERCANELNRIAKINGKKVEVTVKMLEEMLPDLKVENVFGIASLFTGWRLAKNTCMIIVCWSTAVLTYFVLILNSTRMGGNPFLSFMWQSLIEFPAYVLGRWIGDRLGRRFTNAFSFLSISLTCIPIILIVQDASNEYFSLALVVFVKFCCSITFFAVNLQSMEIYPTCLRQSGISIGSICANSLGVFGPYVVYLGTKYDVRYPYMIICVLCFLGFVCALFLPETLHHKLPNTLHEAQKFGKQQKFWALPQKPVEVEEDELKSLKTKQ
ncbi:CLUMA_CG002518, isoform A [Clunio marinus]|uniref:CLUMA_CG002518, isoform A n=1 Tax=Clunio marinus TaxID=568069 RepID=A0A1J1HR55_9DIPT|nr:CLUMA_CG002518, isoform A [Clunio marinus]